MRQKTVEITLIDGSVWYVPKEEFTHFNVTETPDAIISNYIRGSRGPLLKVNKLANMTGEVEHINANFILKVKVTYP